MFEDDILVYFLLPQVVRNAPLTLIRASLQIYAQHRSSQDRPL
jgi:hypothetical protein